MADSFDDPLLGGKLDKVLSGLKQLDANLTRQINEQGAATAREARTEVRQQAARAAREASTRPTGTPGAEPRPRPLTREGAAQEEAEGVARARQAEARASRDILSSLQRQRQVGSPRAVDERTADYRRLSAAQRIALAEREIGRARAENVQRATRESLQRVGLEATLRRSGLYNVELPTPRRTISAEERAARAAAAAPPAPPRPPPRPTVAAGAPDDDELRRLREQTGGLSQALGARPRGTSVSEARVREQLGGDEEFERFQRTLQQARGPAQGLSSDLSTLSRQQALAGDQMRRHGLLTTEFLSAAADGRTTVRELGVQIGGTIAKFAGWTTAASLTYGALAALQAAGQGALDSAEGVNKLQRIVTNLNTERAQEQFRDLAREFNLPIGQVAAASFESAKAFRTQSDTATATKAALAGVKVGEIDAADAARFATAIYRGFHLEVSELNDVMDVANQLQNRFGADFRGTAEGVAKSAGAFGAAGGNFRELAALVATGQLATGRTGAEIGTALRRTSEIVRRPDRRQRIIDVLGIDPQDSSITEVIERAQQRVARGADVGEVARAITTPELASGRIIPILQSAELYRNTLREAQPDRATGSVARELSRALRGIRQEVEQVGVNLQNLGSALAQSGALDTLGGMIILLNNGLQVTAQLLEAFNAIPRPLRQGVLVAAQLAGTLALVRRFGLGTAFPQGSGLNRFLSRDPARLRRAEIVQGLKDERDFIVEERRRTTSQASRLAYSSDRQRERVGRAAIDFDADPSDENSQRYRAAQRRLTDIDQRKLEAIEESEDLAERHRQITTNEADFRRNTTRRAGVRSRDVRAVDEQAIRRGILQGSSIDPRPQAGGLIPLGTAAQRARAEESAYRRATQEAAAAGRGRAVATGAGALAAGRATAGAAASGARNLATAIASSLGPIEIGVLGLIGVYESYRLVADQLEDNAQRIKQITAARYTENLDRASKQISDAAKGPGGLRGAFEGAQNAYADSVNFLSGLADKLGAPELIPGGPDADRTPQQQRGQRAAEARRFNEYLRERNTRGEGFTRNQIYARLQGTLRRGGDPDEAFDEAFRASRTARGLLASAPGTRARERAEEDVRAFRERLRNYRQTIGDVDRTYGEGLSPDELAAANARRIFARGLDSAVVRATRRSLAAARREFATTNDPVQQDAILQSIQALQSGVEDELKRRLDQQLAFARNPTEAGRARRQYLGRLRQLRTAPIRDDLRRERQLDRDLNRQLEGTADDPIAVEAAERPRIGTAGYLNRRRDHIEDLKDRIKQGSTRRARLRRQLKSEEQELDFLEREQNRAQFEATQGLFDARTERLQSQTADPLAQARILVTRLGERTRRVREALRRGDATQEALEQAIGSRNRAQQQAAQTSLGRFQARQGLASARFAAGGATEAERLRRGLSDAQGYEQAVRAQGALVSPDDLLNAQRAVAEAQGALREYVESQAREMVSARAELALSTTDNPIREANIRLREATQLQRFAKTPAERLRAQAEVNRSRRERQTTIYNEQISSIDFEADIGRIDRDTQIRRLDGVLRRIRGNRDLKRELQRRLYQLRHEEDEANAVDLDVGSIRLPTIYTVRRLAQQGTQGPTVIQQDNSYSFTVNDASDAEAVGAHLERIHGNHVLAGMRSGGLI